MNQGGTNGMIASGDVPIDGDGLSGEQVRLILQRRVGALIERTTDRGASLDVIVCMIGGERFAVPLVAIAEVIPAMALVRVPTAPASLAGLIVRRGLVYNVIDASAALGVASGQSAHFLLLRGPVPRLALRVDEAVMVDETSAAGEIAVSTSGGGGLTETRFFADGARVELIALARLFALLGHSGRTELT